MTFRKLSKCNKVIVTDIYAVVYKMENKKEGIMILKKILKLAEKNNISISCLENSGFETEQLRSGENRLQVWIS